MKIKTESIFILKSSAKRKKAAVTLFYPVRTGEMIISGEMWKIANIFCVVEMRGTSAKNRTRIEVDGCCLDDELDKIFDKFINIFNVNFCSENAYFSCDETESTTYLL